MEVGIHGLNFWRPRKWQLPSEFCQMEDRQCAWRRALRGAEGITLLLRPRKPGGEGWGWDSGYWCPGGLSVERDAHTLSVAGVRASSRVVPGSSSLGSPIA